MKSAYLRKWAIDVSNISIRRERLLLPPRVHSLRRGWTARSLRRGAESLQMTRTRVVGVEGEVRDEDHGVDGGDDGRAVDDARGFSLDIGHK